MSHELFEDARWLIGAIARGLHRAGGEGVDTTLERMAEQDLGLANFTSPEPAKLPVVDHLPQALGEAMLLDSDLAAAIAAVEDNLHWRQSEAYSDAVLGEGFMANYGWTQIIGPHGFFKGDDFLLGLLMLGPGRHYRDHCHPAPELYWPLTDGSLWRRGDRDFELETAGAVIWHPPMVVHATRTGEKPLLCAWSWLRDTAVPARLVEGAMIAQ
jgi:hypothetical protein